MASIWNEEKIDLLTELWLDGIEAREIARRIGVTRNAVIGKAHRLGLPKHIGGAHLTTDAHLIAQANMLRSMGWTTKAIGQALGVNQTTAWKYVTGTPKRTNAGASA